MFGYRKRLLERNRELEKLLQNSIAANEQLQQRAFLLDIQRIGRVNQFSFVRNGEIYRIETVGMISDNLPEWKERLMR